MSGMHKYLSFEYFYKTLLLGRCKEVLRLEEVVLI